MGLPTLTKTWRFAHEISPAGATTEETTNYLWWAVWNMLRGQKADNSGALAWKDSAGAAASAPTALWTVESSGNGTTVGNNDQVNHLTTFPDIVRGNAAASHSWGVLKSTAIGCQVCIDDRGNAPSNRNQMLLTSIAGFGADGTTTNRPTAADEGQAWASDNADFSTTDATWIGTPAAPVQHRVHIWSTTDGTCWRILVYRNGYSVLMLILEKPANPVTLLGAPNKVWNGAEKPYFCHLNSAGSDSAAFHVTRWLIWASNSLFSKGRTHLGNYALTTQSVSKKLNWTTETVTAENAIPANVTSAPARNQAVSAFTNKRQFTPIGLICLETGFIGKVGNLTDIWFGPDTDIGVSEGDNYPDDLTRQFVQCGAFTLPWDGSVMAVS